MMVVAAVGAPSLRVRRELDAILKGTSRRGGHRVHMVKERPATRRQLLTRLADVDLVGVLVWTSDLSPPREARDRLLSAGAVGAHRAGATRLTLDHQDERERARDRRSLAVALRGIELEYSHEVAHTTDGLITAADALAWAFGRRDYAHLLPPWLASSEVR